MAGRRGKFDAAKFGDALAEGVLGRLVRRSSAAGPQVKGKPTYQVRIDNASPLILNGLAVLGTGRAEGETPKELSGICIAPRRSMTVPATEEVVKTLEPPQGHPRRRRRPQRALTPPQVDISDPNDETAPAFMARGGFFFS